MTDRVQDSLVALRRILRATETNARALARATGLTTPQLLVLETVRRASEATPTTIARSVGVTQATATALIEKLEHKGHLTRRRSQSDRRKVWISLTEAGAEALRCAPDPLQMRFSSNFERLPDWQQAMIVSALEQVAALMEADATEASPLLHVGAVFDRER